jgi:hypothetical protein
MRIVAVILATLAAAVLQGAPAQARTVLFVGNSFTQGELSPVKHYRPDLVTDLNGDGIGGVPALFKVFTLEAGLDYQVSLETVGGEDLGYHYREKASLLDRPWDVVVLQTISMLDPQAPGDPSLLIQDTARLAAMLRARNPLVEIHLDATWSSARQTDFPGQHWYGAPIQQMAKDVYQGCVEAAAASNLTSVIPVGLAWNRAIDSGIAEDDPYNFFDFGKLNLWARDDHHASVYGYYLEALVIFGRLTGVDPLTLTGRETAADDLDIGPGDARALQQVAHDTLAAESGAPSE